jgi:hypothetical protein
MVHVNFRTMLEDWDQSGVKMVGQTRKIDEVARTSRRAHEESEDGDPASAYLQSRETSLASWNFGGKDSGSTLSRRRYTPLNASYPLPAWQVGDPTSREAYCTRFVPAKSVVSSSITFIFF